MPKYYITRYALSKGISHEECKVSQSDKGYAILSGAWSSQFFKIGKEAFELFDDARKRAIEMRDKKIKSLKKKIDRLEKLSFEKPKRM
jgi:hypothetical protein